MADTKVSALTNVTAPDGTEEWHVVDSGGTDKAMTLDVARGGQAGGSSVTGGTASGEDLTLNSTSHATKGTVLVGTSALALDEANERLGIGVAAPSTEIHIQMAGGSSITLENTTQATDTKRWQYQLSASSLLIVASNDAGTAGNNRIKMTRTTNEMQEFQVGDSSGSWTLDVDISNGHVAVQCPQGTNDTGAPADAQLQNGQLVFYHDTTANSIKVKHKNEAGTVTSGTVATLA